MQSSGKTCYSSQLGSFGRVSKRRAKRVLVEEEKVKKSWPTTTKNKKCLSFQQIYSQCSLGEAKTEIVDGEDDGPVDFGNHDTVYRHGNTSSCAY